MWNDYIVKKYTTRKNIFNKENRNKLCYINVDHVLLFALNSLYHIQKGGTNKTESKQFMFMFTDTQFTNI